MRREPPGCVEVYAAWDRESLMLSRSLLDSAGFSFTITGDVVQDYFGLGRLGTGFNYITGPPRIFVAREDAEAAREVLARVGDYRPSRARLSVRIIAYLVLAMSALDFVLGISECIPSLGYEPKHPRQSYR
jgi:hypothetical protein